MKTIHWRLFPFILFVILGWFFWRGLSLDPHHLPSAKIGQSIPKFQVPVLGSPGSFLTDTSLHGQVTLLNVWASWCAACVEEQVFMMKLAREGVVIYGLNYKDNPKEAMAWLQEWGNPYRKIGEDLDGKLGIDLGVYGAPETFVVDQSGVIRYRHVGILTDVVWNQELLPLIKHLEKPL